eukprot:TRINITY_DN8083_c0_g1_i2.p1 TRINITY_DN8083_c0_g1~~TRINITY_DN8083_c0_g1_i2.p1  ORF type:complete len:526 (-),score=101.90 TRINITY_DN8083_c0_g1_i2:286-1782(-)
MYNKAYSAVTKYLKKGPWYFEADMRSGHPTHLQFNSLQAFWPGLQVISGDLTEAIQTQQAFFGIWSRFGALPERFLLNANEVHFSEKYYPLRPELIESAYFLYLATRDQRYLEMGREMFYSLENITRVEKGYASIRDVKTSELEDRMSSFFLAETCKYLYLLFDEDNFVNHRNYVFTTEGHLFPLDYHIHQSFGNFHNPSSSSKQPTPTCTLPTIPDWSQLAASLPQTQASSDVFNPDAPAPPSCPIQQEANAKPFKDGEMEVTVGEGSFHLTYKATQEQVDIRNLGTTFVEVINRKGTSIRSFLIDETEISRQYLVGDCIGQMEAMGGFFGPPSVDTLQGEVVLSDPPHACSTPTTSVQGKVVVVERGQCTFMDKVTQLQQQGAVGVLVANVQDVNNLFMMGGDGSQRQAKIPALMITRNAYKTIKQCLRRSQPIHLQAKTEILPQSSPGSDGHYRTSGDGATPLQGHPTHFQYTALGGWTVVIQEKDRVFQLYSIN